MACECQDGVEVESSRVWSEPGAAWTPSPQEDVPARAHETEASVQRYRYMQTQTTAEQLGLLADGRGRG